MSVKITSFEAENVKRVKAVTIIPAADGLTVIGGRNAQGKTSVLDAIAWALGGDKFRPGHPQRDGSVLPPRLRVLLSNGLVVERRGKNSELYITDPSGRKAGQTLLNSFVEQLALDLPKFMAASGREKAQTLLRIIGLGEQVEELERRGKTLYNERLALGRIADQKAKFAKEMTFFPGVPEEPLSAAELIAQQQDILARNGENQRKRQRRDELKRTLDAAEAQLAELTRRCEQLREDYRIASTDAADLLDQSTTELEENIRTIEQTNAKVRANLDKARAEADAQKLADEYAALTAQIEDVQREKLALLNGADMPLPGLSVTDGELTYNGQPWDCMSSSEQLIAATSIVRRLNPECGFVLLDRLEAMDTDTLAAFGRWLEGEGLQAIATRVSTGGECQIIIEDGEVAGAEADAPAVRWKAGEF